MTETQLLTLAASLVATLFGLLVAILGWLGLDNSLGWVLGLVGVLVGLAANTVLFYALFRLLADPRTPTRSLR